MHNIEHRTYDLNCDRDKVEEGINDFVRHETWQEGGSGLYHGIRWIDYVCDSYDDAMDFINRHDNNNYDNLAVKYKVADNSIQRTSRYVELSERQGRLFKELENMENVRYMETVKSELVTCRKCGSKIASKWWNRNTCPVCGEDFRSPTTRSRIQAKRDAWKKARADLDAYRKEYARKHGKVEWLVKFEYHT